MTLYTDAERQRIWSAVVLYHARNPGVELISWKFVRKELGAKFKDAKTSTLSSCYHTIEKKKALEKAAGAKAVAELAPERDATPSGQGPKDDTSDTSSAASSQVPDSPVHVDDWLKLQNATGMTYYFNTVTKKTIWVPPVATSGKRVDEDASTAAKPIPRQRQRRRKFMMSSSSDSDTTDLDAEESPNAYPITQAPHASASASASASTSDSPSTIQTPSPSPVQSASDDPSPSDVQITSPIQGASASSSSETHCSIPDNMPAALRLDGTAASGLEISTSLYADLVKKGFNSADIRLLSNAGIDNHRILASVTSIANVLCNPYLSRAKRDVLTQVRETFARKRNDRDIPDEVEFVLKKARRE